MSDCEGNAPIAPVEGEAPKPCEKRCGRLSLQYIQLIAAKYELRKPVGAAKLMEYLPPGFKRSATTSILKELRDGDAPADI